MPLIYNFGSKDISVPNVLSRVYRYRSLTEIPAVRIKAKITTIDSKKRIGDAWKYIEANCASLKECNNYFSKLFKKRTLADILKNETFTVHSLVPKEGHSDNELPLANSAGKDFALSIYAFLDLETGTQNTTPALAATILHEIAHYAGATTNTRDSNSLEAENALTFCALKRYYNPESKG
jgi:hypothetical protein